MPIRTVRGGGNAAAIAPRWPMPGRAAVARVGLVLHLALPCVVGAQQLAIQPAAGDPRRLELRETLRVGSENGPDDAFGQVTDAQVDSRGRLFVADAGNHHIAVFDRSGKRIGVVGRRGEGPGEFMLPVTMMIDHADTLFVWDMSLARVSVFAPDLAFVRSFHTRPSWVVGSLSAWVDGTLLMPGFTRGQAGALHRVSRDGEVLETYRVGLPTPGTEDGFLSGFETSLLGGTVAVDGDRIVYAGKSPYEVTMLRGTGAVQRICRGEAGWTTPPRDVVTREGRRGSLAWNRYVHVTRVLAVAPALYLVTVRDPVRDLMIADLLTADCRLIRRTELPALSIHQVRGEMMVAVRLLEFPEVLIYRWHLTQ